MGIAPVGMAVHGGKMRVQALIVQKGADVPGGLPAPFAAFRAGQLHARQLGPRFQLVQERKVHAGDLGGLVMAALLISGVPIPLGLVDGRDEFHGNAHFDKMLRHIAAIGGPGSVILRVDVAFALALDHLGGAVFRQPLQGAVAEQHHFLRAQIGHLLQEPDRALILAPIVFPGSGFKALGPAVNVSIAAVSAAGAASAQIVAVIGKPDAEIPVVQQRGDLIPYRAACIVIGRVPQSHILAPPAAAGAEGFHGLIGDIFINGHLRYLGVNRRRQQRAAQQRQRQNAKYSVFHSGLFLLHFFLSL